MISKLKKLVKFVFIAAILLVIFALVFPMAHRTEKFEPRAAAPDGEFVTLADGASIHCYEAGKGKETLLLIHGFAAWAYTWRGNIPELAKSRRVIAPDLVGFGFSDKPADADYGYKLFADTVKQLMDAKGVKRATLIGNSMGGGVSIRLALDYPDRVDKLVLVDSAGVKSDHFWGFKLISTPGVNSLMSSLNNTAMVNFIIRSLIFYDKSKITKEMAEMYMLPNRTIGHMNASARTINNITVFSDDEFAKLNQPTLIIWGEKDKLISPAIATVFHGKVKGSKLVMIPKCGHCPQEEMPDEFNRIVSEFLEGR